MHSSLRLAFAFLFAGIVWLAVPSAVQAQAVTSLNWRELQPTVAGSPNAPIPTGRVFMTAVRGPRATAGPSPIVADDDPEDASVIYFAGGLQQTAANATNVNASVASDFWQFDPGGNNVGNGDQGLWTSLPSLPVGMYGHACVLVPSLGPRGRLFFIGGIQGPPPFAPSNRVVIYDIATGLYLTAAGNPDPTNSPQQLANSGSVSPRAGHAAAYIPASVTGAGTPLGIIVVFGGDRDTNNDGTLDGDGNDLHYIDINTMTWDSLGVILGVNVTGSAPSVRCYTKMWFNGRNTATAALADGVFTDLDSTGLTVETTDDVTTTSRVYLYGGTDISFGGFVGNAASVPPTINGTYFSDVYRLSQASPPNFVWQPVMPNGFGPSPNPRVVYNQCAASPEQQTLLVFGGSFNDVQFYNDIYQLNLGTLGSESWQSFPNNTNPPSIRAYGAAEIVGSAMYMFHGFFDSDQGAQVRLGPESSADALPLNALTVSGWYNSVHRMTSSSPPAASAGGGVITGGSGSGAPVTTAVGTGGRSGGGKNSFGCWIEAMRERSTGAFLAGLAGLLILFGIVRRNAR